jgi:UDP-3-O-[3-hydroxymyristoyl] N-acetylglucosamine deacetylase
MYTQKTIKKVVTCSGIGLHSGNQIQITFKPADVDSGIWFKRIDLPHHPLIKVAHQNIVNVTYATTLGGNGATIQTVEHVLSAVQALGITNLLIEVNGGETPVVDGSAACFIDLLLDAGIEMQRGAVRAMRVTQPLEVRGKDTVISVEPYDGLKITYTIDFPNPFIGVQTKTFDFQPLAYMQEIAHARTFCLYEEIEYLWKMGLSKGGSLDNAVVFAQDRIMNESLRYADEPVRHKILDLIGDLAFLGSPLLGHIKVYKGGHQLHTQFIHALHTHPEHWMYLMERDVTTSVDGQEPDYAELLYPAEAEWSHQTGSNPGFPV